MVFILLMFLMSSSPRLALLLSFWLSWLALLSLSSWWLLRWGILLCPR